MIRQVLDDLWPALKLQGFLSGQPLIITHPKYRSRIVPGSSYEEVEKAYSSTIKERRSQYQRLVLIQLKDMYRQHHRTNIPEGRPPKLWIQEDYYNESKDLLRIVYSGTSNSEELHKAGGWYHYTINPKRDFRVLDDIPNPRKLYVTFDDILSQLTVERLELLLERLLESEFRGEVKMPRDYLRAVSSFDNLVLHGRTEADINTAKDIVPEVFPTGKLWMSEAQDTSITAEHYPAPCRPTDQFGQKMTGTFHTSYSSFLASKICAELREDGGCHGASSH